MAWAAFYNFTQRPPYPHRDREGWFHPTFVGRHATDLNRMPLGLTMRPAPRIIRELHPNLSAYRVPLFFHATKD